MIFGKAGAIGGAIVLLAIWPFATGQIAQSMYERQLQKIQTPILALETVSYKRGYLSSDIVTRVLIKDGINKDPALAFFPREFLLLSTVDHGFLGATGTTEIKMTPQIKAFTDEIWAAPGSPASLKTDFALLGDFKFDFVLQPVEIIKNSLSVTSSSFFASGEIDKEGSVTFDMKMPLLNLDNENAQTVSFKDFNSHGRGKMMDGFWLGDQFFNVSLFDFNDGNGLNVTVTYPELKIDNSLNKEGDVSTSRLNSQSEISFKKLELSDAFVLDNFKAGLHLQEIHFPSLVALLNISNKAQEQSAENKSADMMQILAQLFEKGLNVKIEPFEVDSREGHINARLDLVVNPHTTQNISDFTENLNGDLLVDLPRPYVEGIPSVSSAFKGLALSGFVSENTNGLTLSAKIEQGNAISSSGVKIPLALFVKALM